MTRTVRITLPLAFLLVCFGLGSPAFAQSSPAASRWWQQAGDATYAAIASLRTATTPRLGEMPAVAATLKQRAKAVNQRAVDGNLRGQDLYPKIPPGVRLTGQAAIVEYLTSHHVSHILSAKNHPALAAQPANLVFEPARWNLARGFNDMALLDRARAGYHNAVASAAGARLVTLATMAKGGAVGAVVELPVTATVETLNVVNERKTVPEAARDAASTVGVAVLAGGATAGTLTVAGTLGFTVGAPIVVPLAVVAGTAYVWISSERIWRALDNDTRAAIEAGQVAIQRGIQDHARAVYNGASATVEDVHRHIDAAIDALAARQ